jgi:hypothetical protein
MSALELAALGAALFVALTPHGAWRRPIVLPPQLGAAGGSGAFVFAAQSPLVRYVAAGGLLGAFAALFAVLPGDRWIGRRAMSRMRWENFDRDFRAYAGTAGGRCNRPPSVT